MYFTRYVISCAAMIGLPTLAAAARPVATVQELVAAVRDGAADATIEVAAGTFELDVPLDLKTGMTLKGAGIDKTVLTHTPARRPSTATLPDPEMMCFTTTW